MDGRKQPVFSAQVLVQRFESGLQARRYRLRQSGRDPERFALLLTAGEASLEINDEHLEVAAPALVWLGHGGTGSVSVEAGGAGFLVTACDQILVEAVGGTAESTTLSNLAHGVVAQTLEDHADALETLRGAFVALEREMQQPRHGSPSLISAYLRIVLVTLMRVSGQEELVLRSGGEHSAILQRFRALVEARFRDHWTITRYADELGMTRDRLHAICRNELGRSPKALVAERMAHEAGLRLERSSQSIEQLSHALGFRDPSHFSNFFKRLTGTTPARYRRRLRQSDGEETTPATNFSDWP